MISKRVPRRYDRTITKVILTAAGLALALAGFFAAPAQSEMAGGVTAASYLKIGLGARSAGMGGAFTALADDGSAAHWNPAGLAQSRRSELMLSHFSWLQDISIEYAAFASPMGDRAALGASFLYVNYGVIEGYENNVQTANTSAYNYAASLSGSYYASDKVSLGATVKLISEGLGDVTASTFAFDAGLLADAGRVRFGAALSNLGGGLKFINETEKLPAALRVGVAALPFGSAITTSVEVESPFEGNMIIRSGFEYNFNGSYFLRSGYSVFPTQEQRDPASGLSFGAGLRLSAYELNYAFSPQENLAGESIHRFSLSLRFGG